jgi:hypothetical protein
VKECDNYGLRSDAHYHKRETSDEYFDELDHKYAKSFIFGKEDEWEALMKEELCRGMGVDLTILPPMEKPQGDLKGKTLSLGQHPGAYGQMSNLLRTIPEVECQAGLTKIVSACDDEKQEVTAFCCGEIPIFDFTNDK